MSEGRGTHASMCDKMCSQIETTREVVCGYGVLDLIVSNVITSTTFASFFLFPLSNREEYNRSVAIRLTGQSERIFGVAYEVIRSGLSVDLPVCTFSQLAVKFGCVEAAESSQLLQNHLASVLGDSSHDALFVAVLFSLVCKWKKV